MAYWQRLRGLLDPFPLRVFKGIYKPEDQGFDFPEEYATEMENFTSSAYPQKY